MFDIPEKALLNRRIPKVKFYKQIGMDTKLKKKFIDEIEAINWKYKLSQETTNLRSAAGIEEIQIFEINLKDKHISNEILENIDRVIPYPILFILKYDKDIKLAIAYKEKNKVDENKMVVHSYHESGWEREHKIDIFKGLSIKDVYDNLIRQLISVEDVREDSIERLIELSEKQENLKKEIGRLEKRVKKEKQFDRKVNLNIELQERRKELEELL